MQSTDLHHQFQLLVQLLAILLVELVLEELLVLDLLKEVTDVREVNRQTFNLEQFYKEHSLLK